MRKWTFKTLFRESNKKTENLDKDYRLLNQMMLKFELIDLYII
jgi:hypothetical protein